MKDIKIKSKKLSSLLNHFKISRFYLKKKFFLKNRQKKKIKNRFRLQTEQQSQYAAIHEATQLARTIALCCRVYVGSIMFDVSQEDIQKVILFSYCFKKKKKGI